MPSRSNHFEINYNQQSIIKDQNCSYTSFFLGILLKRYFWESFSMWDIHTLHEHSIYAAGCVFDHVGLYNVFKKPV